MSWMYQNSVDIQLKNRYIIFCVYIIILKRTRFCHLEEVVDLLFSPKELQYVSVQKINIRKYYHGEKNKHSTFFQFSDKIKLIYTFVRKEVALEMISEFPQLT